MTDIIYTLKSPIPYTAKGQEQTAEWVSLYAPTFHHSDHVSDLKQLLFQAFPDNAKSDGDTPTEKPEVQGKDIAVIFYKSPAVSLKTVLNIGKKLLTMKPAIAKLDGDAPLTPHLLTTMSPDDVEGVIMQYIAHFILASVWSALGMN